MAKEQSLNVTRQMSNDIFNKCGYCFGRNLVNEVVIR